ncbi:unnamed protein product [Plutella xylostella]|uniref:(diamondback moth) hypothetical protein n=1 Tax=Plutella xylostella TaxID=51655 RepID=A0A8S4EM34_PLUXY|nr:unnamed protein product [Plutella xylostella]
MPRLRRSPPPLASPSTVREPQLGSNMFEALGSKDSEIENKLTSPVPTNSSRTKKRQRPSDSPTSEKDQFDQLRDELRDLFSSWKDEQGKILQNLMAEIREVKSQNQAIKTSNKEIEKSIDFLNSKFEDLKNQINSLEGERKECRNMLTKIENKIQDLQCSSRSAGIEIRNMPMKDKETTTDLLEIISKIGKVVALEVSPTEIRDVYRLPGKAGSNKTIVAEFATVHKKQDVLLGIRSFNRSRRPDEKLNSTHLGLPGTKTPIYVADYLPPNYRKLAYMAREYAKNNGYKFCWISNGKIFLRRDAGSKQIPIISENCITNLNSMTQ